MWGGGAGEGGGGGGGGGVEIVGRQTSEMTGQASEKEGRKERKSVEKRKRAG